MGEVDQVTIRSYHLGSLCSCCALALANADTSGCEYNCPDGHAERLCQFGLEPGENAVVGDSVGVRMFRCVGCGDDVMDWGYEVHILTERPEPEDNS